MIRASQALGRRSKTSFTLARRISSSQTEDDDLWISSWLALLVCSARDLVLEMVPLL